ncbi:MULTISPECIES: TrkA family potassium uptake protein [Halobacterium]|uniref:potassium channel family protein n=1 Tax=Halobacterium TaxID=2239 RepID=UPI001966BB4F|nr:MULTISPECIES: TrkA family potassium uptake protein [Halobacterium]MCF2165142.1 TrkA family potassium uptake protein [Halobacterium salinarum]MCF2168049.1 TrkA family potassium uptake protein [Halobacterium salinarum]MCF2207627.1 TrkA family potassium uptake protein [Halobacterium salinarum]MCF2239703.1 TrkA family potassium uptake protein [Halobacterium salinarum]MDL0122063.1 TrkA family potassium uptake protein [Halobacterium salinarum]
MYIIVVGAGDIGSQVIQLLTKSANEIVVIETDPDVADQVSRDYDCLVLNADATAKDTLVDAGSEKADAIITTTDRDPTNIMVMLLADELDIESKVSVVQDPDNMELFRRIGVNVLENPQRLIGEYLVRAVQRPSIKDFMTLGGEAEVFEITVTEDAPLAEQTLQDADTNGLLGDDVLVVAIERGDDVITPRGETTIHAGDLITAFSKNGVTSSVMQTFTGSE